MPEPKASHNPPPGKPPRRLWLLAPYIAVAFLAVLGSAGWFKAKLELERRLDLGAEALRAQGFDVSWTGRRVSGFPFRLDLTLQTPRLADRTGWAVSAPQIAGEALAYDPAHWIVAAPEGLTLTRPGRGALVVTGQALRASVSGLGTPTPRFSLQGLKLVFTPQPGAAPGMLASADMVEAHLQPGPDDQAALLIRLDSGRSAGSGALARPADTLALMWDSRLSHMSALAGSDWPSRVRHWSEAGGDISVVHAALTLGGVTLDARPARLTVGADGRLRGVLPLGLSQGRLAKALLGSAPVALSFQDGIARLGPLALGPALRVF